MGSYETNHESPFKTVPGWEEAPMTLTCYFVIGLGQQRGTEVTHTL